nr:basic proline-rich protein-like [Meriones unguiculatus]
MPLISTAEVKLPHPPSPPTPVPEGVGDGRCRPTLSTPARSAAAASDPAGPCTCCHPPGTRRRRPSLRPPSPQGATFLRLGGHRRPRGPQRNFVPGESGGQTSPGALGEMRGTASATNLYLQLWLGSARSPGQALSPRPAEGDPPASVARSGEAGSPDAHAPPPRWPRRGAEPPLPARPPRPRLGPPPRPPPRPLLPTSGLPGSPPPHRMAAPATGSRTKPEAAAAPSPPPSAGRRPVASAFLPRRARSGTYRARAGLHPSGGARSPRGPPRPGGAGGRSWPVGS